MKVHLGQGSLWHPLAPNSLKTKVAVSRLASLARFLLLHKLNIGEMRDETDTAFFGLAGESYV